MPRLSRVGLGAWAFGGVGWGPQDDADSVATIRHAVARGVDWIDTAAVYGGGHAERIVGEALPALPADGAAAGLHQGRDPDRPRHRLDLPRPQPGLAARAECEDSLRAARGRADRPLPAALAGRGSSRSVEAAWATLGELSDEGKIRWAGVEQLRPRPARALRRIRPLDAAQLPLSLLEDKIIAAELPWLAERGVATIVYSPLESGLLSGTLLGRAPRGPARGRLAPAPAALPEPRARPRAGPGRAAAPARRRARDQRRRAGDRLDHPPGRRRRGDRRRPHAGPGRRLDRRRARSTSGPERPRLRMCRRCAPTRASDDLAADPGTGRGPTRGDRDRPLRDGRDRRP